MDSLDVALTQLSTTPNSGIADSEPKSKAPNWRFSPGMSAEPGISTAVEGIYREGGNTVRFQDYDFKFINLLVFGNLQKFTKIHALLP